MGLRGALQLAVLAQLVLLVTGCALGGYAARTFAPPNVEAQYVPSKRPLLVLVKDQPDPTGARIESEEIAALVEELFKLYDIAPVVPSDKATDLRTRRTMEFALMSPAEVGRAVGAQQVLFIRILNSIRDSEDTRDMLKAQITASISVVDAQTNSMLWPRDGSTGAIITHASRLTRVGEQTSVQNVERQLHQELAIRIVKLFRKYKVDE